ncbi:RagB/SusD family nutrient uptake outer membrane protein [Mucilaginibacter sp. L196]|uniref:RagB/SusD family nutrient uptake outer membrane protein n=1 Tax=Mucilaginibacter sp. L196 TaxID=1641870 RepID=UPI00131B2B11|nr:RagB/SusD family nutrient uptake outer membrane protein [Mucilaginibacter sp. L196]
MTPTYEAPFPEFNKEVVFSTALISYISFYPTLDLIVDSTLYKSYNSNDLRPSFYFFTNRRKNIAFQGSYTGLYSYFFGGIATDEIYLIRAECYARASNTTAALNDLNTLLQTRYLTGTFTNLTASSADAALALILAERRKELCFRNLRWSDLRRLNKDPRFQVTLTRTVNGQLITLPPNSPKYVLPLDPIETTTGGLEQNPR